MVSPRHSTFGVHRAKYKVLLTGFHTMRLENEDLII